MTPLDAARQLAEMDPIMGFYGCFFCQHGRGHGIDCPVPMLPQIVAELAEYAALKEALKTKWTVTGALKGQES